MKWIMKAFRHSQSIEIVLPKQLCKELGWGFNTHFIVEPHGDKQAVITSLDDWTSKTTTPATSGTITEFLLQKRTLN